MIELPRNTPQLGVGMDMPWGTSRGFAASLAGDTVAPPVAAFFERFRGTFSHVFMAFQPRSRAPLRADDYFSAYDKFFEASGSIPRRAFHHTMLNLAGDAPYDRTRLAAFTNKLISRYKIEWVNEDVGIWSLRGKALPYPLPPILTERSLELTIKSARETQRLLDCPLVLEFPGFTEGSAIIIGNLHAYDFFRVLAEEADCRVNLDTGHLISYQHLRGRRGPALLGELDKLPLDRCFEVHLAGSELTPGTFRDMHHGVLLDEQLQLLQQLMLRCPHMQAVTYEDPRFSDDGELLPQTVEGFERLRKILNPTLKELHAQ